MLKKFFVAAMMSVLVVVGQVNLCDAMPYSEMYLGGLTAGSSYADMVSMYGEPVQDRSHASGGQGYWDCWYGNSVKIHHYLLKRIDFIKVTENNGWKTPSGLAVSDNISKALDICGEPDYKKVGAYKTAYCYVHTVRSKYSDEAYPDRGFFILFNNNSGKILELSVYGQVGRFSVFNQDFIMDNMEKMVQ